MEWEIAAKLVSHFIYVQHLIGPPLSLAAIFTPPSLLRKQSTPPTTLNARAPRIGRIRVSQEPLSMGNTVPLYLYQAREPSERPSTDSTREASAEVAEVRPRS